MRSRTHAAQREPPYGRETVFWRLLMRLYSRPRCSAGIPARRFPQPESPHITPLPFLPMYWTTSLPPGVFTLRTMFDLVVNDLRLRYVTRSTIVLLVTAHTPC